MFAFRFCALGIVWLPTHTVQSCRNVVEPKANLITESSYLAMSATVRLVSFVPLVIILCVLALGAGVYAGATQTWPLPELKRLYASLTNRSIQTDRFGRLLKYPGKSEIACPSQDNMTAVLLVIGQSNAANFQGQRYQSEYDRVINFAAGHCYRAASPLLGAEGQMGETWTLLGTKLIRSGLYRTVILIPAAVGGSEARRWANGGNLNAMMVEVVQGVKARYNITGVLLDQGAADFALHTPEDQYRSDIESLIDTIRAQGVHAPFFITRCSVGGEGWSEDNPIAKAQASLADSQHAVFNGPNTDHDLTPFDRYDGYHFAASGQEKYSDAWIPLLRAHPGTKADVK
jgi:Carbohydrate esterase, sialic acid-specific acetylesterase